MPPIELALVKVAGLDWVDLVMLVLILLALVRGLRLGATVQVLTFGGFWVGLLGGALLAPHVAALVSPGAFRTVVSIFVVFGMGGLVSGIGRTLGTRAWRVLRRVRLGSADSSLGAAVAGAATLFACWIAAGILVSAPFALLSAGIEQSQILRAMDSVLPPAPSVFSRIERLVSTTGLPPVFAQLAPQSSGPVAMPSSAVVRAAYLAAQASMVKVEGVGCNQIQEGSGFVVAPGLVVTNAHVVAGLPAPEVIDRYGISHHATPIYFDPDFDLAVLKVPTLHEPVLHLDTTYVQRGMQGAVLGYPEGGPLTVDGAGVQTEFEATGRDIYGQGLTVRSVYQIQALVRPGNSGGPLVEPDGLVIGVVFSKSESEPNIGYALASPGVAQRVAQAEANPSPSGTGHCAD